MIQTEAPTNTGCEQISLRLNELRSSFDEAIRHAPRAQTTPGQEFLLLTLSGETYAFPVAHALEILQVPTIVPIPGAKPSVLGFINFRGQVLLVTTIHAALGLPLGSLDSASRIIVTRDLGIPTGILVDGMEGIVAIAAEGIQPAPATLGDGRRPLLTGQVYKDEQLISVVNIKQLCETGALEVA